MTRDGVQPGIMATLGDTPLVRLDRLVERDDLTVLAKLESFNPGGSAKDRSAVAMVEDAVRSGRLVPGGTVVESSSGNFGMALARLAAVGGWTFHCVVDPRVNTSTAATIEALGGIVHRVTEPDPASGDWLAARRALVGQLVDELPRAITLDQYANPVAVAAHRDGGVREVVDALGHAPDRLYVAVSTTGTIGGSMEYLASIGAGTHVVAVDALGSVLFGGERGERHLGGYGAGVVPPLAERVTPHEVVRVADLDAVVGCRVLARREGILAGASGGGVVSALLRQVDDLPSGCEVVLLLHDGGQPYLDTVWNDGWVSTELGVDPTEVERRVEEGR